MVFELHIRLDESSVDKRPAGAKAVALGQAKGWQTTAFGQAHGTSLHNVETGFSFSQLGQTDDGSLVLVSTPQKFNQDHQIYNEIVDSLKFSSGLRDK